MKFKSALFILFCTPFAVQCITVQSGSKLSGTPDQRAYKLAKEIAGDGVEIIDAKLDNCDHDQIGLFTDADTELGMNFENGIVLSTGLVTDVKGKNDNVYELDVLNHAGFIGLDNLIKANGGATRDACALHITFNCEDHTHFGMKFVFGSDNYNCPSKAPYITPNEDVMGIFVTSGMTFPPATNIARFKGNYISVNTFTPKSAPANFVSNCPPSPINIELNGFSRPIGINNEMDMVKTGKNELWVAVADGYDASLPPSQLNNMRKPSYLFVLRDSLVCIDKTPRRNLRGGVVE